MSPPGHPHGQVQPGLAPQGWENAVGALPRDYGIQDFHREGFDVDHVGYARVCHDGGRVGVYQDRGNPFLTQGLAGLGAGIVELCGLSYDDGARADDQDLAWFGCHFLAP